MSDHRPSAWRRIRPWLGLIASFVLVTIWLAIGAASSGGARVPQVECGRPSKLELRRFEDGSAQLYCGRGLLVRISVPW